jgi:hypothetical protein
MILECIVTTLRAAEGSGADEALNIAPMGPIISEEDLDLDFFTLRPYQTATTFANLRQSGVGVLHICDDVELLARAAISCWESLPPTAAAAKINGRVLSQANRWYEFEVDALDDTEPRSTIRCRTVHRGRRSDLIGLNRAKHAVLEAAILMTRLEFLSHEEIGKQLQALQVIVGKTAGASETRAFQLLQDYFDTHTNAARNEASKNQDG